MPGKCKFQDAWLSKAIYKDWLVKDSHDIHFARCRACCKSIKLRTMGEAALTSHSWGAGHKAAVRKLLEGNLMMLNSTELRNDSVNQTRNRKVEEVPASLQQEVMDRIQGNGWSDLRHNTTKNSSSHNAELQDVTYPASFTAPDGELSHNQRFIEAHLLPQTNLNPDLTGDSSLIGQHLHPSSADTDRARHRSALHDSIDLSRVEDQQKTEGLEEHMRILEWESRMKVLALEQELVKERRRAIQQKGKAFRMKKAYYKAKLKRLGEDVLPSSSSGEEEEKPSNLME